MYRIAGFIVFAFQRCGDRVREAARCHVGRLDDVGRRGGDRLAGLYVREGALRKRHARDLGEGDRDFLIIDILDGDRERNRLAFGIGCIVRLAVVLRYDQRRIRRFGDCQRADRRRDRVVALDCRAVPNQRVRVVALANQRLAARDRERRRLVVHESGDAAGLRQRRAVIFLLAAFRRNRQRRRRYLQRAFGRGVLIVRVGRLHHVGDRALRNVRDARCRGAPGHAVIGAVLDRRALGHARGCAAVVRVAVIDALIIDRRDRHGRLGDRQFAGGEVLFRIVVGDVFAVRVHDGVCLCEATIIIGRNVRSLCRGVDDLQRVACAQTFDRIVIRLDGLARAGDGRHKRTAFLLGTVIDLLNVLDRNRQRARRDIQGAEGRRDRIVARIDIAPNDLIDVIAAADRRLRTNYIERDRFARAKGDRTGRRRRCRSPFAADIGSPVAVVQRCAFFFRQRSAVIRLFVRRRRDGQRKRFDHKEAVTSIERDRIVRIAHHCLSTNRYASNQCCLLRTGKSIGSRVLLRDQRSSVAGQSRPDRIAVLRSEEISLTARDVDIRLGAAIIQRLFAGIRETDVENLSRIVVRTGSAGVRVPLVGADADVNADRLNRQAAGHVDDAIVDLRVGDRLRTHCDLRILRRCRACTGVRLGSVEFNGCHGVATQIAGDRVVRFNREAAEQRISVIRLYLIISNDDQFPLIIDIDHQIAFFAGDLIGRLRRIRRVAEIRVMIDVSFRRLVLHGVSVALFYKGDVRVMDAVAVHVKVVDRDLGRGEADILEGNDVVFERQLLHDIRFGRLIMLAENIRIIRLGCQICGIHFNCRFFNSRRRTGNGDRLGLRNLDFRMILQNIIDRICQFIRDRVVIEDDDVLIRTCGKRDRIFRFVGNIAGDRRRFLCMRFPDDEIRVGDDLVFHDLRRRTFLIIMYRVGDGVLLPMRIQRDVFRHRHVPVIRRTGLVRRGEPAEEGVVRLCGIRRRGRIEAVFTRLLCRYRRAALRIKRQRAGREAEVTVEYQTGRHLGRAGIRIRILMLRIGKPTEPFYAAGRTGFRILGRNIARQIAADICIQRYLLCADQCAVIVVEGQRILQCIIVEIRSHAAVRCAIS